MVGVPLPAERWRVVERLVVAGRAGLADCMADRNHMQVYRREILALSEAGLEKGRRCGRRLADLAVVVA